MTVIKQFLRLAWNEIVYATKLYMNIFFCILLLRPRKLWRLLVADFHSR